MGLRSAIALISVVFTSAASYASDCASVLALSHEKSKIVSDEKEVKYAAEQFCKEYKSYVESNGSTSVSGSYLFLISGSVDTSSSNLDQTASRYCSASEGIEAYSDSYRRYIDAIAPGAFDAYKSCIESESRNLLFKVDPASILPKEFNMSVIFNEAGDVSASMTSSSSSDVNCTWSNTGTITTKVKSPSGVILSCSRKDGGKPGFVRIVRTNGIDDFTMPWPAYSIDGNPVDVVKKYTEQVANLEQRVKDFSAKSVTRVVNSCDWSQHYQADCEAKCPSGTAISGSCDIGDDSKGRQVSLLESTSRFLDGKGWSCRYVNYVDGFPADQTPMGQTLSIRSEAVCFDSSK